MTSSPVGLSRPCTRNRDKCLGGDSSLTVMVRRPPLNLYKYCIGSRLPSPIPHLTVSRLPFTESSPSMNRFMEALSPPLSASRILRTEVSRNPIPTEELNSELFWINGPFCRRVLRPESLYAIFSSSTYPLSPATDYRSFDPSG